MKTKIFVSLRNTFLAGLGLLVPLFFTTWVLSIILGIFDKAVPFVHLSGVPGAGILVTIVLVFVAGLLVRFYFGKKLFDNFEKLLANIPIIGSIYGGAKQVVQVFSSTKPGETFERVVLIEWPRKDIYAVAFVTKGENNWLKIDGHAKKDFSCVFVPNVPSPATGFFMLVPKHEIHTVNLSVEEAIKMFVSGGIVTPQNINKGEIINGY